MTGEYILHWLETKEDTVENAWRRFSGSGI